MRSYLLAGSIFILASAALLLAFGPSLQTAIDVTLVLLGLLPEIIRRTPSLYLRWTRLKFLATNATATWDIAARFEEVERPNIAAVAQELIRWSGDGALVSQTDNRAVLRLMRRFVVQISTPNAPTPGRSVEHGGEFELSVLPVTIGYRDSRKFMDRELLPLMEKARELVKANWAAYTLRVDLPEPSPYFGLYLQSFKVGEVQDFRLLLAVPSRTTATKITVAKDKMTVVSDTIQQFRIATAAALAFQVPEA